jgi:glutamate 5-kinase
LLPVGICQIEGSFSRGATVRIIDLAGEEIALGMTNYSATDLLQITGHRSEEIEEILGFTEGDEIVHHNNMLLLKPPIKRQKGA